LLLSHSRHNHNIDNTLDVAVAVVVIASVDVAADNFSRRFFLLAEKIKARFKFIWKTVSKNFCNVYQLPKSSGKINKFEIRMKHF